MKKIFIVGLMLVLLLAMVNAAVINFDDKTVGSRITTQYMVDSVTFVATDVTTPLIINAHNRGGKRTISEPNSLMNDANYPRTSAKVPLTIKFSTPVKAVSMYVGNGNKYGEQVTATLTAYDQNDMVTSYATERNIPDEVTRYISIKGETPIYKVTLDYGNSALAEVIDDLSFVTQTSATEAECTCDGKAVGSTYRCDWINSNVLAPKENGAYNCRCSADCVSEIAWNDMPYTGTEEYEETPQQTDCTDSDGKNLFVKGTTSGYDAYGTSIITVKDYCTTEDGGAETYSGAWVVENLCDEKQHAHAYYYLCPTSGGCVNGQCVGETNTFPVETPIETSPESGECPKEGAYKLLKDQEKIIGTKKVRVNNVNKIGYTGNIGATLAVIEGENYKYASFFRCQQKDIGSLKIWVKDYYSDGTDMGKNSYVVFDIVEKEAPKTIPYPVHGILVAPKTSTEQAPCEDTDNGIDIYTSGYAHQGEKYAKDYCLSDTVVMEADCGYKNGIVGSAHPQLGAQSKQCEKGFKCYQGACVKSEQVPADAKYPEVIQQRVAKEPEYVEYTPYTPKLQDIGKCKYPGLRYIDLKTKTPVYCDENLLVQTQKEEGIDCQNNFECVSNYCGKGNICVGIQQQLEETRGWLRKLLEWFGFK